MNDRGRNHESAEQWSADFAGAEGHRLDASLSVTAAERLKWPEEALKFAARVSALPKEPEDA